MTPSPSRLLIAFLLGLGLWSGTMPVRALRRAAIDYATTHEYRFAQQITFRIQARGDAPIVSAVVHVRAEQTDVGALSASFEPAPEVHAEVSMELRGGVLPPFGMVTYWWELRDEMGNVLETSPVRFQYTDNRYTWRRTERDGVAVYWLEGERAFAENVLDVALSALPVIAAEIGVARPAAIDVYVYPDREDLISVLSLGGRDWAGGQARPELGVVLFDLPPTETAVSEIQRVIPHELTHLLVYAATQPGYTHVPAWLDEGLATANEVSPSSAHALTLQAAAERGALLSFEQLCASFPLDDQQARLAYAQSGDLIQLIRNRYGRQAIQDLLAAYRDRADCAAGVERALHVTLSALEADWRARLASGGLEWSAVAEAGAPWLGLLALVGLTLLPMLAGLAGVQRRA